jgi:type I restriction enzyme M protein
MTKTTESSSDLAFTAELFKAADKLRGNLEPSEYKHVALGLIFLKYISDAFEGLQTQRSGNCMKTSRTASTTFAKGC